MKDLNNDKEIKEMLIENHNNQMKEEKEEQKEQSPLEKFKLSL